MNFMLWLWLIEEEQKRREEDGDDVSWGFMPYKETRWDKFCAKHPLIDRLWPYAAGIGLFLVPLLLSCILWKLWGI